MIGGGTTGAAYALDAERHGIRTALLEAGDFAGATSSAATESIHGGVRYLEEAIRGADLREHHVLLRLAGPRRIAPSKCLSQGEALKRVPNLNEDGLLRSVGYSHGQFDDARYNMALVQSFIIAGGSAVNYTKVIDFRREANRKISGVVVKNQLTEDTFTVDARAVVNATGPLFGLHSPVGDAYGAKCMRPSKSAHILLPLDVFPTRRLCRFLKRTIAASCLQSLAAVLLRAIGLQLISEGRQRAIELGS